MCICMLLLTQEKTIIFVDIIGYGLMVVEISVQSTKVEQ